MQIFDVLNNAMEKVKLRSAWEGASIAINNVDTLYFAKLRSKGNSLKLRGIIVAGIGGVHQLIIPTNPNSGDYDSIARDLESSPTRGLSYLQDYFAQINLVAFGMEPESSGRGHASEFLSTLGIREGDSEDIRINRVAWPHAISDSIIFKYTDSFRMTNRDRSASPSAVMRFHAALDKAQIPLSITPLSSLLVDRFLKTRVGVGLSAFFPEAPKHR